MNRTNRRRVRIHAVWLVALAALVVACAPAASAPTKPGASASGASSAGAGAAPSAATAPSAAPAATPPPAPTAPAAAAAPAAPPRVALRVAVQGRPDQAHLQLALDRGYFSAQGLDVETVQITSGAEMVPALATNQIQVGNGAPSAALYNALNRDVNIRIVADYAHVGPPDDTTLAILVRKELWDNGTVRTLADLKGGRTFVAGTVPGTVSDLLYNRALAKEGINGDDIKVEFMPFPDIYAALGNGRADAGTLTEPLATQAVQQGVATVLYPSGAVIPGAILSVLQYSPPFVSDQPDAATRFMVGYLQGVRDYYDAFVLKKDRDAAIDTLLQSLSPKNRQMWETAYPMTIDQNGVVNVDDLKDQAAFYAQRGDLQGGVPDIMKYVDTRFAEAAVQILGRR